MIMSRNASSLFRLPAAYIAAVALACAMASCAEVPITHRRSLHLVPDSELMSLSYQQYNQVLHQSRLSTATDKIQMVRRVGNRIARSAEAFLTEEGKGDTLKNYVWQFNLIDDEKTANAWVMPGGRAAVYSGILRYTQNETGLAVVLGHEVGHAIAGHGNERMSHALVAELGGMALAVALSQRPQESRDLFMAAFGAGASIGFLLPFSRVEESEADRIGLVLMARAGYDPRQAVPFWERMRSQEGHSRTPELLSTHPAPETRIEDIRNYMPVALKYYQTGN
jgi:predicted Zn-dependent protease